MDSGFFAQRVFLYQDTREGNDWLNMYIDITPLP